MQIVDDILFQCALQYLLHLCTQIQIVVKVVVYLVKMTAIVAPLGLLELLELLDLV
jgi:hypothetical protein